MYIPYKDRIYNHMQIEQTCPRIPPLDFLSLCLYPTRSLPQAYEVQQPYHEPSVFETPCRRRWRKRSTPPTSRVQKLLLQRADLQMSGDI